MKRFLARLPLAGPMLLFFYRARIAWHYVSVPLGRFLGWLFRSRETTNFTYPLTPLNRSYLISFVSEASKQPYEVVEGYIEELEADTLLKSFIQTAIVHSEEGFKADKQVYYGRRLGWYAFIRILKPKVVVETGVDKGLGSCVITAALMKNTQEGYPGYYYGTDINPKAGYLLQAPYNQFGKILYGDSIQSLQKLEATIDLFINDSDHSPDYEAAEYQAIEAHLSPSALVLGDNSHYTPRLLEFARRTGRRFLFFQEQPDRHWYPGAGIGACFPAC
jgi:predicted O-methyltransferase YrrM